MAHEEDLLDLFADIAALTRPEPEIAAVDAVVPPAAREYLLGYLASLDPDRANLPDWFRARLSRALGRYGTSSLTRTVELEDALVWLYRSSTRLASAASLVTAVLDRRLARKGGLPADEAARLRPLLERVIAAAAGRCPEVADLARELRFDTVDGPLLDQARDGIYTEVDQLMAQLVADPARPDRDELVDRLVWAPVLLRARLRDQYRRTARPELRALLLETRTRRFYRHRNLHDLAVHEVAGQVLTAADYEHAGRRVHLVTAYCPLADLDQVATAVRTHLAELPGRPATADEPATDPDRSTVVDLSTWHSGALPDAGAFSAQLAATLSGLDFGRRPHRLDIGVTSDDETRPEHNRTWQFSYRPGGPGGGLVEDRLYRNLHPMLAKRIELWRLGNFTINRLPSEEDVYVYGAVAKDNPADERLFALGEVRDLPPVLAEDGSVAALPHVERIMARAMAAIRYTVAHMPPRQRPLSNRIILYVRPEWTYPPEVWRSLAHRLAPLTLDLGLEKVVVRMRLADPAGGRPDEVVLTVENVAEQGLTVRLTQPSDAMVRALTPYRQKVLRAERAGAPYPYELVRMLTPPDGMPADFPPGEFVEHDLATAATDAATATAAAAIATTTAATATATATATAAATGPGPVGRLVPVQREPGQNVAGVVVGVISNNTETVPAGMRRVAILGDPTRALGSLAEPECRRIIAALDLAERMSVPVEWFALSAGARIAMDSGSENMDWIAAVLRRIIEFTQRGGEINVVVTGVNVGAQPYWNAEATMLMHTRGILVMTPASAMVLTGKQALDFAGAVSAQDNFGIGGFERVMGGNGQAQYWAPTVAAACQLLLRHYEHSYVVPGEEFPRRRPTTDPVDRDVRHSPHASAPGEDFETVGDIFSADRNPERKKPFDIRSVLRAVTDTDSTPLERWARWADAEASVVWDARIGGIPVCLIGLESRPLPRAGRVPADGPTSWTAGTLFPQSARKVARAINSASGSRPVVVLANLSGFDGSPESMRRWQLEYGAEIGRAVTNFAGPIVFVVVSRYHGGAFVVFSKRLSDRMEVAAVEGSYASVIGGNAAAGVVFAREVRNRTESDQRIADLREAVTAGPRDGDAALREGDAALRTRLAELAELTELVRAEKLKEVADEFDQIHSIDRALRVGSVDRIIPAAALRPYLVDALERLMGRPEALVPTGGRAATTVTADTGLS